MIKGSATLDSSNKYGARLCHEHHAIGAVDPRTEQRMACWFFLGAGMPWLTEWIRSVGLVLYESGHDLEALHDTDEDIKNCRLRTDRSSHETFLTWLRLMLKLMITGMVQIPLY